MCSTHLGIVDYKDREGIGDCFSAYRYSCFLFLIFIVMEEGDERSCNLFVSLQMMMISFFDIINLV